MSWRSAAVAVLALAVASPAVAGPTPSGTTKAPEAQRRISLNYRGPLR